MEDTFMFKEDGDCCVFIIEGAAGNNYYVETERHCNYCDIQFP